MTSTAQHSTAQEPAEGNLMTAVLLCIRGQLEENRINTYYSARRALSAMQSSKGMSCLTAAAHTRGYAEACSCCRGTRERKALHLASGINALSAIVRERCSPALPHKRLIGRPRACQFGFPGDNLPFRAAAGGSCPGF